MEYEAVKKIVELEQRVQILESILYEQQKESKEKKNKKNINEE